MLFRTLKALEFGKVLECLASFCVSEAGKKACLALSPQTQQEVVLASQKLFDEVRTWAADGRSFFHEFPDMEILLDVLSPQFLSSSHAAKSSETLIEDAFWALREVLNLAKPIMRSILDGAAKWELLAKLAWQQPFPEMTLSALNRCLNDDGRLKDESSPELQLVRGELRRIHQYCLRKVKEFAIQYNIAQYLQDEFMTLSSDRYVLPLKVNFKGRLPGIIHDYSNTGETCYFEPFFLVEHNNHLQELKRQEREEEHKIFLMLTDLARREFPLLEATWQLLVRLDVELAKCTFADKLNGSCATLSAKEPLNLIQARHPLLVFDKTTPDPQPVDLKLRQEDRALIISGGNAGGKTVCLKTLGLLVVMTLSGLPIPASAASVVPFWTEIHAFIGDEQSLDDHLSTFTAQIHHLAEIWETTGSQSLILLDEFGAGTDPAEGAALAQSVFDELRNRGAYVAAATHFPALKTYALTHEGVRAASVLFDPVTQKPLFRLAYDQVGASRALDIAKAYGLPDVVLQQANRYLLQDSQDISSILDKLNSLAADREKALSRLAVEQEKLREKREKVQEQLDRERERLGKEVRDATQRILKDWEEGRVAHRQALKEMAKVRSSVQNSEEETPAPKTSEKDLSALTIGKSVIYRPWNKKALIREIDMRQRRIKVDLNGVTLWADADLVDASQNQEPIQQGSSIVRTSSAEIPLFRLDVRGKRADLALSEIESYLDRALLAGCENVEIVHGRGTGALRREVHGFLKNHPHVASFALANEDQGGDGVTFITVK